jgi:hypothetical protein
LLRKDYIVRRLLFVLGSLAMLLLPGLAQAQSDAVAAKSALGWVRAQQQADGSFPGFGPGETADALQAFVAAQADLASLAKGSATPVGYLEAQAKSYATSPSAAAKLTLGAVAAGADPTNFGGQNLLAMIGAGYDPKTGQYGPDVYGHALALLAIRSVGAQPPLPAIQRLVAAQLPDGGWSFDGTEATGSDTNTSGLALQALAGQRQADGTRGKALAYFASQQNTDGGFPYSQTSQFGNDSDANSTALAIQAIIAAGEQPTASRWTKGGKTPIDLLISLQNASGALRYQAALADDNALATYQAVPALLQKSLPVTITAIDGAQALIAPAAAALPATGAAAPQALPSALSLLAIALLLGGLALRRRAA